MFIIHIALQKRGEQSASVLSSYMIGIPIDILSNIPFGNIKLNFEDKFFPTSLYLLFSR